MSMNSVHIQGTLVRDVELKYTSSNRAYAKFSIVCVERYTTKSGEKREEKSYFDCVAWGPTGERIAKWYSKGSEILLDGSLKQERWETQEGDKRSKVVIVLSKFHFQRKPRASEEGSVPPERNGSTQQHKSAPSEGQPPDDDSGPF